MVTSKKKTGYTVPGACLRELRLRDSVVPCFATLPDLEAFIFDLVTRDVAGYSDRAVSLAAVAAFKYVRGVLAEKEGFADYLRGNKASSAKQDFFRWALEDKGKE